jgi:hypothetical protein
VDEFIQIEHFLEHTDIMVFTDSTQNYFGQIPFLVRAALAHSPFQPQSFVPFEYNMALKRPYLSGVGITLEKSDIISKNNLFCFVLVVVGILIFANPFFYIYKFYEM